jgi:hypothetical protein
MTKSTSILIISLIFVVRSSSFIPASSTIRHPTGPLWGTSIAPDASSESPAVPEAMAAPSRGKVNEIDFCIAPADVSLSRSYSNSLKTTSSMLVKDDDPSPVLSLTRALNNASNRAVRRILLARAWPSAEALNKSFRQAAQAEKEREAAMAGDQGEDDKGGAKCPIPRPILNLLVRRKAADKKYTGKSFDEKGGKPSPRSRTDEEYVTDQLNAFRERYGNLPGYMFAEAYLESILSLATSGKESPRVKEVSTIYWICSPFKLFFLLRNINPSSGNGFGHLRRVLQKNSWCASYSRGCFRW